MLYPLVPENEDMRLQSLRALNILDTQIDEKFELITRFATEVFNVPICLVSLVDENRQWFKSAVGMDVQETPRYKSFCAHAICQTISNDSESRIFEVCDTSVDFHFVAHDLVVGHPGIRSYIGYVLQSKTNMNLGTLCLIDTKPRKFTDDERDLLKVLGRMIQNLINEGLYFSQQ